MSEVDEDLLRKLIATKPQTLRRELGEAIKRLEAALELAGFSQMPWSEALDRYREYSAKGGSKSVSQLGLLPELVFECAKSLDDRLQRIHGYKPESYATEDSRKFEVSSIQDDRSRKGVEERQKKAKKYALTIDKVFKMTLARLKSDPHTRSLKALADEFERDWQKKYKEKEPPSRNTFKKSIERLLPDHPKLKSRSGK